MCVFALLVPEINSDAPVQKANACSGGSTAPGPHAKESVPPPHPLFCSALSLFNVHRPSYPHVGFFSRRPRAAFCRDRARGFRLSGEAVKWEKEAGDSSRCVYTALFCCKNCVYVHCRHNSQCVLKGCGLCRQFFHPIMRTRTQKMKKKKKKSSMAHETYFSTLCIQKKKNVEMFGFSCHG